MSVENVFSLRNKTVLITGASSGIGQGIAIACAQQGAKVLLLGRSLSRLEKTLSLCQNGQKHGLLSLDLNEEIKSSIDFHEFIKSHAPINGFVHAAGISPTIPLRVMKKAHIIEAFQLNVFSAIDFIQELLKPGIKTTDGMSMVFISSVMSEVGEKGKSLYSMTKASLVALCKSLSLEYANKAIRFNAVSPSVVDTPLSFKSHYRNDEEKMKAVLNQHPLGLGHPSDVANSVVFLLSDASKWITGTNMIVDGGYLAR